MDRILFVINIFEKVEIFPIFWSLFVLTASVQNEVYYVKHTGTGPIKAQDCAVQYMDVQYGVVKVRDDGTSCDHETWTWFDNHSPEAGYTYYVKEKMKISFNPPIQIDGTPTTVAPILHSVTLPSPMTAGKRISIYFTPILPFYQIFVDLRGSGNIPCHFSFSGDTKWLMLNSLINGQWSSNAATTSTFPFTEETTYKVTLMATVTEMEAYIDDILMLTMNHARPLTELKELFFAVNDPSEALLHGIDLFMD